MVYKNHDKKKCQDETSLSLRMGLRQRRTGGQISADVIIPKETQGAISPFKSLGSGA